MAPSLKGQRRGDVTFQLGVAPGLRTAVVIAQRPGDCLPKTVCVALVVHKAQGLTVDRGVVVVDEAASAELVYVGMTRGRLENQACMVVEIGDEHGWRRPPTPAEALADALGRSGAELSATEVLRSELDRSEDLAVLVPALIEARRLVNRGAGPDRHEELRRLRGAVIDGERVRSEAAERLRMAEQQLERAQAAVEGGRADLDALSSRAGLLRRRLHAPAVERAESALGARLGWLGGVEREVNQARRGLKGAEECLVEVVGRFGEVAAAVTGRETWLAEHPTEVNWKADLAERVTARRRDLALAAEQAPSPHVLRLVGPPPLDGGARKHWLTSAGSLEAYREQWRVEPDHVGREENLRGVQALAWDDIQLQIEAAPTGLDWLRWAQPVPDRGLGIEL